ncbi:MAG: hypothetical protein WBW47_05770 [Thermoplasmata archaeon]
MGKGVVRLKAKAGIRGAKIVWLLEGVEPSEDDFSGEQPTETLVNYGARDLRGGRADLGLAFWAWRCAGCKVVSFAYPQGTTHW